MSLLYALFDKYNSDVQKTARSGLHILLGGICANNCGFPSLCKYLFNRDHPPTTLICIWLHLLLIYVSLDYRNLIRVCKLFFTRNWPIRTIEVKSFKQKRIIEIGTWVWWTRVPHKVLEFFKLGYQSAWVFFPKKKKKTISSHGTRVLETRIPRAHFSDTNY